MKHGLPVVFFAVVALAAAGRATVTINLTAGRLYGSDGTTVCPDNGLVQLVAAGADGVFTAPSAGGFVRGDDVLLRSFAMNSGATGQAGVGAAPVVLDYGRLGLAPGQRLALRWYPTLSPAATAPAAGTPFGHYSGAGVRDGSDSEWILPPEGWSGSLNLLTVAAGGGSAEATGAAAELVASVPGPVISRQPTSATATAGAPAALSVSATGTGLHYQWYRGKHAVGGATGATLAVAQATPSDAGIYEVVISAGSAETLSLPAVLGVIPPAGVRTVGAVETRAEWQDIRHPNGNIYDQFLLSGGAGTFTAAAGKIARISFLDTRNSIVQVEMSGAGAVTVVLDDPAGPMLPTLYNQNIEYMRGSPTVILAGADATTHLSIYSVGTRTNPGVTRNDVVYEGWARVTALGIGSRDGGLGGLHLGNVGFSGAQGPTGIVAFDVATFAQSPAVVHDIGAVGSGVPYLSFGAAARVGVKIAGGSLAQPVGVAVTVSGLSEVQMGAGQDSCGVGAPAQTCAGELELPDGTDVTSTLVTGP